MPQRILVTGASGQLGPYLLRAVRAKATSVEAWCGSGASASVVPSRPVDLRDPNSVAAAFRDARPEAVIHAAALAAVADCYRDPAAAHAINVGGSTLLVELAAEAGARFVQVSTDLVFDGEQAPYREEDAPGPLSVYGRSKAEAERAVLAFPRTAVVRVSLLYGPGLSRRTFFDGLRQAIAEGRELTLFDDEWRTPLDLPTAAEALSTIAASDFEGVLHLGGPERMSRLEMGERLARLLGCAAKITAVSRNSAGQSEPRPRDVSLDSSRWRGLFAKMAWPRYEDAVAEI
jgi:dTDP-4-dehydrorhamnose reductase